MKKLCMIFLCFWMFSIPQAFAVVACLPCTECGLTVFGGAILPASSELVGEGNNTMYEKMKAGWQTLKEKKAALENKITSWKDKVVGFVSDKFNVVTGWFVSNNDEKSTATTEREKKAQANSSPDDSVQKRMADNLGTYEEEKKGDYENEYKTFERRQYIRQQANIKLLARLLVLKSHFKDMEKLISDVDKTVSQTLQKADGGSEGMVAASEEDLLQENAQLKLVHLRLMQWQKEIEAANLEYIANNRLASMKRVKSEPKISSTSSKGGSSAK